MACQYKIVAACLMLAAFVIGGAQAGDLASCISQMERVFADLDVPVTIESYSAAIKAAHPELTRLSEAPKLHIESASPKPDECHSFIEDIMALLIELPCYYTYASGNQLAAYVKAKAASEPLERVFGPAAACTLKAPSAPGKMHKLFSWGK